MLAVSEKLTRFIFIQIVHQLKSAGYQSSVLGFVGYLRNTWKHSCQLTKWKESKSLMIFVFFYVMRLIFNYFSKFQIGTKILHQDHCQKPKKNVGLLQKSMDYYQKSIEHTQKMVIFRRFLIFLPIILEQIYWKSYLFQMNITAVTIRI